MGNGNSAYRHPGTPEPLPWYPPETPMDPYAILSACLVLALLGLLALFIREKQLVPKVKGLK